MVVVEKRILVVDDEEIVRESCKRALTEAGYSVHTVGSGNDALQACRSERFDLMFTDLKMPDMDGLDVIRAVTKEFPGLRVVVITGYPSRDSAEQAAQLGVSDYLEKPLSPGRLSEATASALAHPPKRAATATAVAEPDSGVTVTAQAPSCEVRQAEATEAEETPGRRTHRNVTRQVVLISMGFLAGVTIAYILAPVPVLAYLAVGAAIAAGTIVGLFSDALFAKHAGSETRDEK
ncbi:MAG TPA: response regulator [Thermoguttaceae bacterium]|nr:response regulator [Thermoguttaceae bacterium]